MDGSTDKQITGKLPGIFWFAANLVVKGLKKSINLMQFAPPKGLTTVFLDTRLWKTKHPRKRFQNFRQSYLLSTDRIEIHQSQPA